MSVSLSPPTELRPDSTPSGPPEAATTTLIQRILASQAWILEGSVTINIPLYGSTIKISLHGSTLNISLHGFTIDIPLNGVLKATFHDFANLLRHVFDTLFASSLKGMLSRSPVAGTGADSGDDDDPDDEDYDPSNDDDREALDADEPYEYGSYRLDRADRAIVEQQ